MAATIELSSNALDNLCQSYHDHNYQSNQPRNLEVLSYEHFSNADTVTGFLGRHQILTLQVRRIDNIGKEHFEKIRFFTKSPPLELISRMIYIEEMGVFKKEMHVYHELLPEFEKIFPNVAPKCYYADERLLVFEHLADQGFRMAAERDGILNYAHLHYALKSVAALHASSIVYEVRHGCKLNELHPETVLENAYPLGQSEQHSRILNFKNANLVFIELIKNLKKYQHHLDYILHEFPKRISLIFQLVQTSTKYLNVFNHGDLWANNVMFQYDKFGESPLQCRLVDFQLSRYAPPMLDLMALLTIPTTSSFRKKYMPELLSDYYRFMTDFLKREQLSIEDFLTPSEFDEMIVKFRIVGLIESLMFSHLTDLPTELTASVMGSSNGFDEFFGSRRVDLCLKAFKSDDIYRERLTDMLEDFIDSFILNDKN
ncbi:uncharacterized protein [Eurosta solidaginis]|uniref:uncharacterized protein n=1 Tax=Eurosta solidaginis TaxID=178769 RepID=UPI003530F413